jgi:prophage maintenance system killer protein
MEAFLESNGYKFRSSAGEIYDFLIGVAGGRASEGEVERWIARNSTELEK